MGCARLCAKDARATETLPIKHDSHFFGRACRRQQHSSRQQQSAATRAREATTSSIHARTHKHGRRSDEVTTTCDDIISMKMDEVRAKCITQHTRGVNLRAEMRVRVACVWPRSQWSINFVVYNKYIISAVPRAAKQQPSPKFQPAFVCAGTAAFRRSIPVTFTLVRACTNSRARKAAAGAPAAV